MIRLNSKIADHIQEAYDKNSKNILVLETIHIPYTLEDHYYHATVTFENFKLKNVDPENHWDDVEVDVQSEEFKKNLPKMIIKELPSFLTANAWGITKESAIQEVVKFLEGLYPDVREFEMKKLLQETK